MNGAIQDFDGSVDLSSDAWRVRVGPFEGPLDLLLHLVRVNELDVRDLPIAEVARQYQEYLDLMLELDLEVAGEYLVMAATLLHIKSRMLLSAEAAGAEEGVQEDPRGALVEQLVAYQHLKQAAEGLAALDGARSLVWTRPGRIPGEFEEEEAIAADLFDLLRAFRLLLERLGEEEQLRVSRDRISVPDRISWLGARLREAGAASFSELFEGLAGRAERIATFLAVLEMVRLGVIAAYQRRPFDDLYLVWKGEAPRGPDATA